MRRIATICALACTGLVSVAQADVYRSVDRDGGVHYSDRWVPGSELIHVDKRHVDESAAAARISSEQAKLAASSEKIAADQSQAATDRAVRQDVAKARQTQCKEAKDHYQKAVQARRIFRKGADGKTEYLSDAEADQQRVKAREDMDLVCGTQTPR